MDHTITSQPRLPSDVRRFVSLSFCLLFVGAARPIGLFFDFPIDSPFEQCFYREILFVLIPLPLSWALSCIDHVEAPPLLPPAGDPPKNIDDTLT